MTSRLILLPLLSAIFVFYSCNGEETVFSKLANSYVNCKKLYPSVSPEDGIEIMKHEKNPTTRDEMCLTTCTLKGAGLIKNGKADMKAFGAAQEINWSDPGHRETAMKISIACSKEYAEVEDECEYGGKIIACMFTKNKQDNLPPPTLPGL